MTGTAIVWDRGDDPPPGTGGDILYWRRYHPSAGVSVPGHLEKHSARLRAHYIAFVHDLGETVIGGKRIVEHLDLGEGFSFWWMTHLAERSPFKSPRLYACLRLLALEEILNERKPSVVTLESADRRLAQAAGRLCENLGIRFVWRPVKSSRRPWSLRAFYSTLPHCVRGLLSLRHLITRWPLRKLQAPPWFAGDDAIFLCSYFFNLDPAAGAAGRFSPRQWEGLPACLHDNGKRANWLHHFLFSPGTPDIQTGLAWLRRFNSDAERQGCHLFLESCLSRGIVLRALKNWLRLVRVSWRLRHVGRALEAKGPGTWLWPLLHDDWHTSLSGPAAVSNCLWLELFDVALESMPRQKRGFYIWENQGWECALIRAWRRHGHGEIIGVPHATVVYWHLNNFDDPRSLAAARSGAKPLPDRLAVNGPMAWKAFVETGYPSERLVEAEALRFLYLTTLDRGARSAASPPGKAQKKILVLGDFTREQTLKMLRCMEEASRLTAAAISITLKPHPVCPVRPQDWPTLAFEVTDAPLAGILPDFDLAFSSNSSSAGLDALLAGLSTVVFLDDEDFNHSPLRGVAGVQFASTPEELAQALQAAERSAVPPAARDFFWLDSGLPRWRGLLSRAG